MGRARVAVAGSLCLVTGPGSGIGRATARELARGGGRVLAADIVGGGGLGVATGLGAQPVGPAAALGRGGGRRQPLALSPRYSSAPGHSARRHDLRELRRGR